MTCTITVEIFIPRWWASSLGEPSGWICKILEPGSQLLWALFALRSGCIPACALSNTVRRKCSMSKLLPNDFVRLDGLCGFRNLLACMSGAGFTILTRVTQNDSFALILYKKKKLINSFTEWLLQCSSSCLSSWVHQCFLWGGWRMPVETCWRPWR